MERAARVVLFFLATLLIVSCGGGSGNTNQGGGTTTTVTSVTPSCTPATVTAGATSTCSATVQGQDNPSQVVTWSVSPASAGTITTAGVFTSSSTITAVTTATITAASTVPGYTNVTGTATVTINPPPPPPPPVVTISATPTTIIQGQTTNVVWAITDATTSISVSGPGLTTSSDASGNATVTPPTTGTATYTATATNAGGTTTETTTVTVTTQATITSVTAACTPASITTTQTSQCSATVTGTGSYSSTVTWTATGGSVSTSGVFTPSGAGSASVTATSTEDASKSGSATIAVTAATPVITSITPRVQLCAGECGQPQITVYGSGFVDGQNLVCTPNPNIQLNSLINSGEAKVTLGIDQEHAGYGDRSCKVCNSDGVTGCSNSQVFGLYYLNTCVLGTSNIFCLNLQETVAGKHLWPNGPYAGQPENGYVDVFSLTGEYESNFFVGADSLTSMALDSTSNYIVIGGSVYDQSGNLTFITPSGGSNAPITAVAAYGGYGCFLQPSANTVGCFSLTEGSTSSPTVNDVTVGNNPQSLTMGQVNGKTYAFVLTSASGGATTIESVDVSDGMTGLISKPVTGITAGIPGGSGIITLDSLGIGLIVSYGDNIAIPFNETTLTAASGITLPGLPVNVVADTTNGVALVGNANATTPGGNFTVVNPVQGTAIVKTSDASSSLPVGVAVVPSNNDFLSCSSNGTACSSFPLP